MVVQSGRSSLGLAQVASIPSCLEIYTARTHFSLSPSLFLSCCICMRVAFFFAVIWGRKQGVGSVWWKEFGGGGPFFGLGMQCDVDACMCVLLWGSCCTLASWLAGLRKIPPRMVCLSFRCVSSGKDWQRQGLGLRCVWGCGSRRVRVWEE